MSVPRTIHLLASATLAIAPLLVACTGGTDDEYGGNGRNDAASCNSSTASQSTRHFDIIGDAASNFDPTQPLTRQSRFFKLDRNRTLVPDTNVAVLQEPAVALGKLTASEIRSKELVPGDVVTLWWAFFTNQDDCLDGKDEQGSLCGPGDLTGNPSIGPQFGYAGPAPFGAAIADQIGDVVFATATTDVVDINSPPNPDFILGNGLQDLYGSEIHLVLRTQGPALGGDLQDQQLSRFDGGCKDGEPNQALCKNVQHAFFPPIHESICR